jgi:hypothetical protein
MTMKIIVRFVRPDVKKKFNQCIRKIPKRGSNGNFHTTRPVGRPRTRWTDVIQRDALQLLGIRGWRNKAANRD